MAARPPNVLFVCTGNVCRSPMAECLMRARLPAGMPLTVESAGTAALAGQGMDSASAEAITELGADPRAHVARQLDDEILGQADLVLTAETSHRRAVLARQPRLMTRTFTLAEFARLASSIDPSPPAERDLIERVGLVAGQRGRVPPPVGDEDDIADPFRQPLSVARTCAAQIESTLGALLELVLA